MQDARVPELRERLGLSGEPTSLVYDKALADAVKDFQKQKGLAANGAFTSATVGRLAMNGPAQRSRGRQHDRHISSGGAGSPRSRRVACHREHPGIHAAGLRHRSLWQTRIVVGKPGTPTPLLSETMKYITVNPTWNVPPSIVYGAISPRRCAGPTVLARMGLRVSYNRDGGVCTSRSRRERRMRSAASGSTFPTSSSSISMTRRTNTYFAHESRAYSHGCMRVQDPDKYAEVLLSIALPNDGYTAERIRRMYGQGEIDFKFPTPSRSTSPIRPPMSTAPASSCCVTTSTGVTRA